jgi:DNA-3-methyladenine glycosylase I
MNKFNLKRCYWVNLSNPKYIEYHDNEWGVIVKDDNKLFELLILEGFQAGLSWECILNKRESFRDSFDNFVPEIVAEYDDKKVEELLNDKDIVRNKLKIRASINNARIFLEIQKEFGSFYNYLNINTGGKIIKNTSGIVKKTCDLSDKISCDLRRRGMKFVGSTIIYSYLQAIGIIDNHEIGCFKY